MIDIRLGVDLGWGEVLGIGNNVVEAPGAGCGQVGIEGWG